jgi:hypothetical protein
MKREVNIIHINTKDGNHNFKCMEREDRWEKNKQENGCEAE